MYEGRRRRNNTVLKLSGYDAMRLEPGKDHLFSMRDEVAHAKLRNKMASGVSPILLVPLHSP